MKVLLATGVTAEVSGVIVGIVILAVLAICLIILGIDFDAIRENKKMKKEEKKKIKGLMKDRTLD